MREEDLVSLGDRIAETATHVDAALHRLLTDLRTFDAEGGYYRLGAATCSHWLSWRVGWEHGTAREHVRVARALGNLPLIDDALRLGKTSYSKVRAMTRVATPENERLLLAYAGQMTGQQLEIMCRKYALVQRIEENRRPRDDRDLRYVRRRDCANGMVKLEAFLHPDEAALIWAALDRAAMDLTNGVGVGEDPADIVPDPDQVLLVPDPDQVVLVPGAASPACLALPAVTGEDSAADLTTDVPAEACRTDRVACPTREETCSSDRVTADVPAGTRAPALDAASGPQRGTTAGATPAAKDHKPPRKPIFDRADALLVIAQRFIAGRFDCSPVELVVTVPAAALRSDAKPDITNIASCGDDCCIPPVTARRLACDAGIVVMTENEDGQLLSVKRKTRAIPSAIKRALLKRDRTCRFPGCSNRLWTEGHHIVHWADGGETSLANLLTMCSRHHRFVHENHYTIEFDGLGEPRFFDERGRPAQDVPPSIGGGDDTWDRILHRHSDLDINEATNAPRWDGEPIPYDEMTYYLYRADAGLLSPTCY